MSRNERINNRSRIYFYCLNGFFIVFSLSLFPVISLTINAMIPLRPCLLLFSGTTGGLRYKPRRKKKTAQKGVGEWEEGLTGFQFFLPPSEDDPHWLPRCLKSYNLRNSREVPAEQNAAAKGNKRRPSERKNKMNKRKKNGREVIYIYRGMKKNI